MGSLVFRIAGSGGGGGTCADGSWVTGKVGSYALEFDGGSDYVNIGNAASAASTALQPSSGTLAGWIKSNSDAGAVLMGASKTSPSNPNKEFGPSIHVGYSAAGGQSKIYANLGDGTNTVLEITALKTWTDGWHHVAMTWNSTWSSGADLKIYVDGVDSGVTTLNAGTGWNTTSDKSNRAWWIGDVAASQASPYDGAIDDVAVWDVRLDSGAISDLYNSGTGTAASNVSSSNIVGYWSMEEGAGNSTLTDRGPNGYDGTLTNMDTGSC